MSKLGTSVSRHSHRRNVVYAPQRGQGGGYGKQGFQWLDSDNSN